MFCNYSRSINKALLTNELFHWFLSRILNTAIENLVCGKPSKVTKHVLHYIYPLKKHKKLGIIARYIDQNKAFGFIDFQYYYIVDSFDKSQFCPLYRFSNVLYVYKTHTIISRFSKR